MGRLNPCSLKRIYFKNELKVAHLKMEALLINDLLLKPFENMAKDAEVQIPNLFSALIKAFYVLAVMSKQRFYHSNLKVLIFALQFFQRNRQGFPELKFLHIQSLILYILLRLNHIVLAYALTVFLYLDSKSNFVMDSILLQSFMTYCFRYVLQVTDTFEVASGVMCVTIYYLFLEKQRRAVDLLLGFALLTIVQSNFNIIMLDDVSLFRIFVFTNTWVLLKSQFLVVSESPKTDMCKKLAIITKTSGINLDVNSSDVQNMQITCENFIMCSLKSIYEFWSYILPYVSSFYTYLTSALFKISIKHVFPESYFFNKLRGGSNNGMSNNAKESNISESDLNNNECNVVKRDKSVHSINNNNEVIFNYEARKTLAPVSKCKLTTVTEYKESQDVSKRQHFEDGVNANGNSEYIHNSNVSKSHCKYIYEYDSKSDCKSMFLPKSNSTFVPYRKKRFLTNCSPILISDRNLSLISDSNQNASKCLKHSVPFCKENVLKDCSTDDPCHSNHNILKDCSSNVSSDCNQNDSHHGKLNHTGSNKNIQPACSVNASYCSANIYKTNVPSNFRENFLPDNSVNAESDCSQNVSCDLRQNASDYNEKDPFSSSANVSSDINANIQSDCSLDSKSDCSLNIQSECSASNSFDYIKASTDFSQTASYYFKANVSNCIENGCNCDGNDHSDCSLEDPKMFECNGNGFICDIKDSSDCSLQHPKESRLKDTSDCSLKDRSDCNLKDPSVCSVKDPSDCSLKDPSDCSLKEPSNCSLKIPSYCSLEDSSDCSLKDASDSSLRDACDCSLRDACDCILRDASDCSLKDPSVCSVKDPSGCSLKDPSDCSLKEPSNCSLKNPSYCSLENVSDGSLEDSSDSSLMHACDCSLRDASDCSLRNTSDCSLKDPSDCHLKDPSDCSLKDLSDCSLKDPSDCSSKPWSECSINLSSDCSAKATSDCSTQGSPKCCTNLPCHCCANDSLNCITSKLSDCSENALDGSNVASNCNSIMSFACSANSPCDCSETFHSKDDKDTGSSENSPITDACKRDLISVHDLSEDLTSDKSFCVLSDEIVLSDDSPSKVVFENSVNTESDENKDDKDTGSGSSENSPLTDVRKLSLISEHGEDFTSEGSLSVLSDEIVLSGDSASKVVFENSVNPESDENKDGLSDRDKSDYACHASVAFDYNFSVIPKQRLSTISECSESNDTRKWLSSLNTVLDSDESNCTDNVDVSEKDSIDSSKSYAINVVDNKSISLQEVSDESDMSRTDSKDVSEQGLNNNLFNSNRYVSECYFYVSECREKYVQKP